MKVHQAITDRSRVLRLIWRLPPLVLGGCLAVVAVSALLQVPAGGGAGMLTGILATSLAVCAFLPRS
jgi:hypothetical protein